MGIPHSNLTTSPTLFQSDSSNLSLLISIYFHLFFLLSRFLFVTVTFQPAITTTSKMRVSCFFVSVAVILAQQASAAPILGLPSLPLIGNEIGVMHSLSNTLEPVPLVGPLTGDVLQSQSEGDLLTTAELAGNRGLISDDSRVGEIVHSIERREDKGLLSGLVPVTDSLTNMPLLSHVGPLTPTTHRLTSQVGELDGTLPIVSDVTNNVSVDLPLNLLKRSAGIPVIGSIPLVGSIPGLNMLGGTSQSSALTSLPGLSAIPSLGDIPGMSSIGSLTSALPIGGFMKRDSALGSLPLIGSTPGLAAIPSLPGLSSISSMPSIPSIPSIPSMPSGASSSSNLLSPLLGGLTSSLL